MKEIEIELQRQVQGHHTPSVQYAYFTQDQIKYRYTYGLANVGAHLEAKADTTYHGFSTTKTFTAIAILKLVAQGKMSIDEPVIRYLPTFPYSTSITIRQLLTHTAGIPNPVPLSWIHLAEEHPSFSRDDYFKPIFGKHPAVKSKPNEKFVYSNLGYILLGQVIEHLSGMSYEQFIEQHVIRPLGLGPLQLGFVIHDPDRNARGYHKKSALSNLVLGLFLDKSKYMGEPEGKWKPFKDYYVNGAPYGGLIGTADAYVTYVQELLKPATTLISAEHRQLMFTENHTLNGKATGMCLSWYTGVLNGRRYYTHAGGGGGYYCEIRVYPEIGVGSVIMFNRTGMTDERFLDKVDGHVLGQV